MPKKIVNVAWQCPICKRIWSRRADARDCETSAPPTLKVGDVVIWHGWRDYPGQNLVFDWVTKISPVEQQQPGHAVVYNLSKEVCFYDHQLRDERQPLQRGFVNFDFTPAATSLHNDRVEMVLRHTGSLAPVVSVLRRAGLGLDPRLGRFYQLLRSLEYGQTWSSSEAHPNKFMTYRLAPARTRVLAAISREPTDAECLSFIFGRHFQTGQPQLNHHGDSSTLESRFVVDWGAMVEYRLNAALALLSLPKRKLIRHVRDYRAALLRGEVFATRSLDECLFPMDESKAVGRLDPEALAWIKTHHIRGSGPYRLRRLHEYVCSLADSHRLEVESMSQASYPVEKSIIFPGRQVICVLSGKGGVGKSTVTAFLARALAAQGRKVLVFDCDVYGPSQQHLFPVKAPRLKTRRRKLVPHRVDGIEVVSVGHLLEGAEPVEWRGPQIEAFIHLLATNLDSQAEVILCDMPPGTGDTVQALLSLCPHAHYLFVATAGELAISHLRRAISLLSAHHRARIAGVVENMKWLCLPEGGRAQLWGGEGDVRHLAGEFHLRYLGGLPMITDGAQDNRLAIMQAEVLPTINKFLAGGIFQRVAPEAVITFVDDFVARHHGEDGKLESLYRYQRATLARWVEAGVTTYGGDPRDRRYRPVFRQQYQRLVRLFKKNLVPLNEELERGWWTT